jgi:apolipoprotein N-acyltransferase
VLAVAVAAAATLPDLTPTGRLRVAMVQGNDKNRDPTPEEIRDRYILRNHLRLAGNIRQPVDLIILPESSLDADPRQDPYLDVALTALAADRDADVLAGGNTPAPHDRLSNTVFHYRPEPVGQDDPTGRTAELYSKRHLVPFGEYVPLKRLLFFVGPIVEAVSDYSPGTDPILLPVAGHLASTAICYEVIYSSLIRAFVTRGSELLTTITNDAWYGWSSAAYQHWDQASMRAIEEGRYLARAANTGISGFVDPYGRVLQRSNLFESAVLVEQLRFVRARTIYSRIGDLVGWISVTLTIAALWASRRAR